MEPSLPASSTVRSLFDEMAKTYGLVHVVSSLGFGYLWRRQCAQVITRESKAVLDVMAGAGEMAPLHMRRLGPDARIILVDFSPGMCAKARENSRRWRRRSLSIVNEDALALSARDEAFDGVTCAFGLKTLSDEEVKQFARELWRVTRRGGSISLLEFSVPQHRLLYPCFKFYVKCYVPFLGRLFLGNPDNYRMLWEYTSRFGNCSKVVRHFEAVGFKVEYREHFFGCASQIIGFKV